MELQHRFVVPASIEETWAAFNDIESIAPCFPGASLSSVEGDEFKGQVKVKLGPIAMQYNGTAQFVERDEAGRRAVIDAKGKDKRGNGTANAKVVAQLTPDGEGTAVEVSTDLTITGKPAQFGRGVIQDVSDKLLDQFVDCIAGKLGSDEPEAATPEPTPAPEPVRPTAEAEPAPAAGSTTATPPRSDEPVVDLDLMSTVLPVLLRRYAAPVAAATVATVVTWAVCRRRYR